MMPRIDVAASERAGVELESLDRVRDHQPGCRLAWQGSEALFDHLWQVRSRGLVSASTRRSEEGRAARELGLVNRFGALSDTGSEFVGIIANATRSLRTRIESEQGTHHAAIWVDGRRAAMRVELGGGRVGLGVTSVAGAVGHLLDWIAVEPTWFVGEQEAVTVSLTALQARYEEHGGQSTLDAPTPGMPEWFRRAWEIPGWRSVFGWSEETGFGIFAIDVPGFGWLERYTQADGTVALRPIRTETVVRQVIGAVTRDDR